MQVTLKYDHNPTRSLTSRSRSGRRKRTSFRVDLSIAIYNPPHIPLKLTNAYPHKY